MKRESEVGHGAQFERLRKAQIVVTNELESQNRLSLVRQQLEHAHFSALARSLWAMEAILRPCAIIGGARQTYPEVFVCEEGFEEGQVLLFGGRGVGGNVVRADTVVAPLRFHCTTAGRLLDRGNDLQDILCQGNGWKEVLDCTVIR